MPLSGSPLGYGDTGPRVRSLLQSIAVAGFFPLEFSDEVEAYSIQFVGGTPAAGACFVGFGTPDNSGIANQAAASEVFDVFALAGFKALPRPTRWVYLYVASATAGVSLRVTALEGEPIPREPSAAEIAAAVAAALPAVTLIVSPTVREITWGAPVNVALAAATSTSLLAANAGRQGFRIQNVGANSVFYRKVGSAASAATDIELLPDAIYEEGEGRTLYRGEVRGISTAGSDVRVEEAT